MAAREKRDEQLFDDGLLADDDLAHLALKALERSGKLFDVLENRAVVIRFHKNGLSFPRAGGVRGDPTGDRCG